MRLQVVDSLLVAMSQINRRLARPPSHSRFLGMFWVLLLLLALRGLLTAHVGTAKVCVRSPSDAGLSAGGRPGPRSGSAVRPACPSASHPQ